MLASWCKKTLVKDKLYNLRMALTDFPEIYQAFLYIESKNSEQTIPKPLVLGFFGSLAKPSPMYSYLPPNEECFSLTE